MDNLRFARFSPVQPAMLEGQAAMMAVQMLKTWVTDFALPVWAERAHRRDGEWVEHLHLDGTPDTDAERRWRVLARQAVAYAHTAHLGWYPQGERIARRTFETYWNQGWTGTHMVHRILPDGTVSDPRADLYDHAFGLLACARMLQLTGEADYRDRAGEILSWIEGQRHPAGGWREGDVKPFPRRQNPHMHLLEASLALYDATGETDDLDIAREVMGLFEQHFLRGDVIGEFFNDDWTLHPECGQVVEPGHAVEWIWLLTRFDVATGEDHSEACHALYDRAFRNRLVDLYDEETAEGEIVRQTTRSWVMTEAVKAHLAMAERGHPGAADMAEATILSMMGPVLTPEGLWVDQRNACGAPIAETIPVSTMYHIVGMAIEAERVASL